MDEAKRAVALANAHIADVCKARGFPEGWAPRIMIDWLGRTETAIKARRDELRKVAYAKIDELERAAIATAKEKIVQYEGQILAGHLGSDEAIRALNELPAVVSLIPPVDPAELQKTLPIAGPSVY